MTPPAPAQALTSSASSSSSALATNSVSKKRKANKPGWTFVEVSDVDVEPIVDDHPNRAKKPPTRLDL